MKNKEEKGAFFETSKKKNSTILVGFLSSMLHNPKSQVKTYLL